MPNPWTNKKKIRGWKKQIRKIDHWYEQNKHPDLSQFEKSGEIYSKLWIDPWYRLSKRNPPLWFFKLILEKMVKTLHDWEGILKNQKKPYDLQIWLFDQGYINSELVCAKIDKPREQRSYFEKSQSDKNFPFEKFNTPQIDLSAFDWSLHKEENILFEKGDLLSSNEIEQLIKEGYKEGLVFEKTENEERLFRRQVGDIWVGRLKK